MMEHNGEGTLADKEMLEKIVQALHQLERQGELILTTSFPQQAARTIFHSALEAWFDDAVKVEQPIECTMPHLLEQTVLEVVARFGVPDRRASEIVNAYYKQWRQTRTLPEMAEVYWHETPHEMAARAYYHIELGKPDERDLEYLAWRRR